MGATGLACGSSRQVRLQSSPRKVLAMQDPVPPKNYSTRQHWTHYARSKIIYACQAFGFSTKSHLPEPGSTGREMPSLFSDGNISTACLCSFFTVVYMTNLLVDWTDSYLPLPNIYQDTYHADMTVGRSGETTL